MKKTSFFLISLVLLSVAAHAQLNEILQQTLGAGQKQKTDKTQKVKKASQTENLISSGLGLMKSLQPIGYKEELAIGGAVALEAAARFGGLVQNPELEKYITTLGRAVASTSDRPDIPYYFGILNTEEPNAFACPGGYIFISRGLLKLVKDEAQLAGILGHEISHVTKKHALEAIRRSQMLSSVSEVTLSAMDKDPKMFDSVVKETTSMLFDKGLDQAKELEADVVGTDYAYRIGYDPSGLRRFLIILDSASGTHASGVFKTHPNTKDRVYKLKIALRQPEYIQSTALPVLADRWLTVFSNSKI